MRVLLLLTVIAMSALVHAQASDESEQVADDAILLTPTFTLQFPAADLSDRFGINYNFGFQTAWKFGKNWHIGAEGNFLFGNTVRETDHFENLLTTNGLVINADGLLEEVTLSQRGWMARAVVGKTVPWNPRKPNNGVLFKLGAGIVEHRILIDVNERVTRPLSPIYQTGYDRMSRGFVLSQFIGLLRLEREQFINLYGGIEIAQGFTRNRRPWDLGTNQPLDDARVDIFIGIKLGWIIPVFTTSTATNYYYY